MEQDWDVLLDGVAEEKVSGHATEDSNFEYTKLADADKDGKFVDLACSRPLVTLDQCVEDEEVEEEDNYGEMKKRDEGDEGSSETCEGGTGEEDYVE